MFLPKLINNMVSGLKKPNTKMDDQNRQLRLDLLPVITDAVAYELDESTTRLCQSVGPKVSKHGEILAKNFTPPHDVMWIEFDANVVMGELTKAGFDTESDIFDDFPEDLKRRLDRRNFGYLIDARYDGEVLVWLFKDRGAFIMEPPVVLSIAREEDGTSSLEFDAFNTIAFPDIEVSTIEQEAGNVIACWDVPMMFCALLNAKNSMFEINQAPRGMQVRKAQDQIKKAGLSGKLSFPASSIVKLSELGNIHDQAIDFEEVEKSQKSMPGAKRRAPPRRHPVRGHPFVRSGKVFWRPPHFRGSGPMIRKTVIDDMTPKGVMPNFSDDEPGF